MKEDTCILVSPTDSDCRLPVSGPVHPITILSGDPTAFHIMISWGSK